MRFSRSALLLTLIACGACDGATRSPAARDVPVLLFRGTGVSPSDAQAFEDLLTANALGYATASSDELNAMSAERLRAFQLLIVPGGDFERMGNQLEAATSARVRAAVNGGLNYLGICAGAFIAGASPFNGFNLTGNRFGFYSAERRGVRKAALAISRPGEPPLEQYWEDGPDLSGFGSVVAKYPDGTPAVVQGRVGKGWLVLAGVHPEAPDSWRAGMAFRTPVRVDHGTRSR